MNPTKVDQQKLIDFVNGGENVRALIRKTPKNRRGVVSAGYQISPSDSDMAYFHLAKAAFESRHFHGTIFNRDRTLEDLEIFMDTSLAQFPQVVANPELELVGMPKSFTRTLLAAYKFAKVMISIISLGNEGVSSNRPDLVSPEKVLADPVEVLVRELPEEVRESVVRESPAQEPSPKRVKVTCEEEGKTFYQEIVNIRNEFLRKEEIKNRYDVELKTLIRDHASLGEIEIPLRNFPVTDLPTVMELYRSYTIFGFQLIDDKKDSVIFRW